MFRNVTLYWGVKRSLWDWETMKAFQWLIQGHRAHKNQVYHIKSMNGVPEISQLRVSMICISWVQCHVSNSPSPCPLQVFESEPRFLAIRSLPLCVLCRCSSQSPGSSQSDFYPCDCVTVVCDGQVRISLFLSRQKCLGFLIKISFSQPGKIF